MNVPRQLIERLRLRSLLGWLSLASFVVAVVRLMIVQGNRPSMLLLFFLPPLLATTAQSSPRKSTRVCALLFLLLLDVGVMIAPFQ
jgi:hypothetical protein